MVLDSRYRAWLITYFYSKGSITELNGDIQQSEAEERALQLKIEACEKSEREKEGEIEKCERDERRASDNVEDQKKAGIGRTLLIGGTSIVGVGASVLLPGSLRLKLKVQSVVAFFHVSIVIIVM